MKQTYRPTHSIPHQPSLKENITSTINLYYSCHYILCCYQQNEAFNVLCWLIRFILRNTYRNLAFFLKMLSDNFSLGFHCLKHLLVKAIIQHITFSFFFFFKLLSTCTHSNHGLKWKSFKHLFVETVSHNKHQNHHFTPSFQDRVVTTNDKWQDTEPDTRALSWV